MLYMHQRSNNCLHFIVARKQFVKINGQVIIALVIHILNDLQYPNIIINSWVGTKWVTINLFGTNVIINCYCFLPFRIVWAR